MKDQYSETMKHLGNLQENKEDKHHAEEMYKKLEALIRAVEKA